MTTPLNLWILRIEHQYGVNTFIHKTKAGAQASLAAFVDQWWPDDLGEPSRNAKANIERYFQHYEGRECYSLSEEEALP